MNRQDAQDTKGGKKESRDESKGIERILLRVVPFFFLPFHRGVLAIHSGIAVKYAHSQD